MRLRATRTRLNIHKAVGRVRGVGKHPPKFKALDARTNLLDISFNRDEGLIVVFGGAHVEKLACLAGREVELLQIQNHVFQGLAFAAKFLGTFRIIPDARILE